MPGSRRESWLAIRAARFESSTSQFLGEAGRGPVIFPQQFSSLRQLLGLRFRLVMGSQIAERPDGSEDGELSSAVLGPLGTSCRHTRFAIPRNRQDGRIPYSIFLY